MHPDFICLDESIDQLNSFSIEFEINFYQSICANRTFRMRGAKCARSHSSRSCYAQMQLYFPCVNN